MTVVAERTLSAELESFINPWGAPLSTAELLDHAAAQRAAPLTLPNLGEVSGIDRLPFEMTRLGWLAESNSAQVAHELGLSETFVDESRLAAAAVSREVLKRLQDKMTSIEWDHPDLIYQAKQTQTGLFLLAANIAAEEGHAGQSRQSEPHLWYIVHPRALQAIVQLAVGHSTEESQLVQAMCAVHDVPEMGLESADGFASLIQPTILTPQDFGALAVQHAILPEVCAELAVDLRSLTKLPGPRPPHQSSLDRAILNAAGFTPRAKAAKTADGFDNLHNPKPGQSAEKLGKYHWLLEHLPGQLEESGHLELARMARAIVAVDPTEARAFYTGERGTYHDMLALLHSAA